MNLIIPIAWMLLGLSAKAQEREVFIVQNLATMKIRVYERLCLLDICSNHMLLEAPMVIGKDEDKTRSITGSFKIKSWAKFYQDGEKLHEKWNSKTPPKVGSSRGQWGHQGAFGWYAAILEPNASSQWLHGTIGWGRDQERFILPEVSPNGAVIRNKSKGCTRVSNQTIAWLRNFVPVGSYVFKIYAKEMIKDSELKKYGKEEKTWTYKFSKGRDSKISPLENSPPPFFEEGSYLIDSIPTIYPSRQKSEWIKGEFNGNPYEVEIRGEFAIDDGTLFGYVKPKKIKEVNKFPTWFSH